MTAPWGAAQHTKWQAWGIDADAKLVATDKLQSLTSTNTTIEATLQGLGVTWLRTVHSYKVDEMRKTLNEAFTTEFMGLKVIIAEGECQLERQRRIKPWLAGLLKRGKRVVRVKYGVDEDVCTGENAHAATLCPSFYRAEIIQNPRWHERLLGGLRASLVRAMQPA